MSLKDYAPSIYRGFLEYETLISVEDELFETIEQETQNLSNNQFVLLANEDGISQYESMLKIVANPATESLQFRRDRIMNRMAFPAPFSIAALRNKLNNILGVGQYNVYIDYSNYTLYIESAATDQNWFNEILVTMVQTKPANIVFINKPLVSSNINMSEEVSYQTAKWNYKAGYWVLNDQPFSSLYDGGLIKMERQSSLQPTLLQHIAEFAADDVASVLINNSFPVSEFITKESDGNNCIIEYLVEVGSVEEVTSIKLLDANSNVLTEFAVYVPVLDDIIVKHLIKVSEG